MTPPRAVVFDIYGTLLEITEAPRSKAEWESVWGMPREIFRARIAQEISHHHTLAKSQGIPHPEVQWPDLIAAIHPSADPEALARFERVTRIAPGATELLAWLREKPLALGLISNAQAYTLTELQKCGISLDEFTHRFLSFEQGFSKPDPEAFRWIAERFSPLSPAEILIVGDREDNDIRPAQAQGFMTWHVQKMPGQGLNDLQNWLKSLFL